MTLQERSLVDKTIHAHSLQECLTLKQEGAANYYQTIEEIL